MRLPPGVSTMTIAKKKYFEVLSFFQKEKSAKGCSLTLFFCRYCILAAIFWIADLARFLIDCSA